MMKRVLAAILLAGVLLAAVLYHLHARSAPPALPPPASGSEAVPVTVARVERREVRRTLALVGTLRADRQAAISPKVPGRILAVLARAGDRVRAGQPLIRLDLGDAQAQVAGAQAGITAAQAQYRKALDGRQARAVEMDAKIAEAESGLRIARIKLRQAEQGAGLAGRSAESDTARARAGVQQAEAALDQARSGQGQAEDTLKRLEFLYAHKGVALADVEGARRQAEIARAQTRAAAAGLAEAQAALRAAQEAEGPRSGLSRQDVEAARAGVQQAEEGIRTARRAKAEALRLADRDIEAARAQVEQARAGRSQATAQVGSSTLTSPLDGIVADMAARAGEIAQPGMPLMTVIAPGSVYLEIAVPARDAGLVRLGQPARVTADTLPDTPLNGVVTQALPIAGADNRSLPARIRLEAGGPRLSPGTMAKAVIEVSGDPRALTIPVDALRNEGNVTFVYAVVDGRAQRRNLTLGATVDQYVQVLSGLRPGETVIVSGPASLQTGMPVEAVNR